MNLPPWTPIFPISGPILRPTATDYRLEAALMRIEARKLYRPRVRSRPFTQSAQWHRLQTLARIFTRIARRKAWAEEMAAHRLAHREAA